MYIYSNIHIYIHIYMSTYIYKHIRVGTCMCICIHKCIYIYTHIHTYNICQLELTPICAPASHSATAKINRRPPALELPPISSPPAPPIANHSRCPPRCPATPSNWSVCACVCV